MAPLNEWIAENAARVHVSSAVDPVSDKSSAACGAVDRTIYTTSDIASGVELVQLKAGAFLNGSAWLRSVEETMPSEQAAALKSEFAELQPSGTVLTVLSLLAEKALGERGAFHGYIQQLPTTLALPMTWSADAKALLKITAAYPIIDDDLVHSLFDRFAVPLTTKFPGLWTRGVTFDDFRWAYSMVSSRAFSIGESLEPTLLPVIDMANHDTVNPAALIRVDDAGGYALVAVRAIKGGEPVTISYGDFTNAQLLCRYGFTLPSVVPSDSILIPSSYILLVYAQLKSGGSAEEALMQLEYSAKESNESTAAVGEISSSPAAKRRKLFASTASVGSDAENIAFALHGDATQEFGLADGLMNFIFANDLAMELLYEVLTVLLQHKDKNYSAALSVESQSGDNDGALQLARALIAHERQVCRRILLGIMSLEEDSEQDDDDDGNEEEDFGEDSEDE